TVPVPSVRVALSRCCCCCSSASCCWSHAIRARDSAVSGTSSRERSAGGTDHGSRSRYLPAAFALVFHSSTISRRDFSVLISRVSRLVSTSGFPFLRVRGPGLVVIRWLFPGWYRSILQHLADCCPFALADSKDGRHSTREWHFPRSCPPGHP